ncbi:MAG TPA: zf-HC2 domain-containing protein [Pyrinomonadaceae bacterium]|nr:zf-HC2 domain-containing protein [Pyrinomonadaceae bacterium]
MRCEDCLAAVEEYFDGELEPKQTERLSAHFAACADCAAALEALSFEQEIYARYDRGLEVSPALWQNVRAGVARLAEAEKVSRPVPPLVGLRGRLAASLSALAPRAAFAPALALVVAGFIFGALWLARRPGNPPAPGVASNIPRAERTEAGQAVAPPEVATTAAPPVKVDAGTAEPQRYAPAPARRQGPDEVKFVNASASAPERPAPAAALPPPADDHLQAVESALLPAVAAPAESDVVAAAGVRLPDPDEKEMARHLEQAQALLRSFQNAGAAGADAAQFAYERRLSRKLLEENVTLQIGAETAGREETKQVLDTLEPFLLDIANLRDNASRDEVHSIKERMRKREIIAALQVY